MINSLTIQGRLVRDPERRALPSGQAVCQARLASVRAYQVNGEWREETTFLDVVAFASRAERLAERRKGDLLLIEGRLRQREWTTAEGQARVAYEVVAHHVLAIQPRPAALTSAEAAADETWEEP